MNFSFQPSIKEEKVQEIIDVNFHENRTNVIFIGNPRVGKSHLAVAIGYEVAIKRNSVYFIKFSKLNSNIKNSAIRNYLKHVTFLF